MKKIFVMVLAVVLVLSMAGGIVSASGTQGSGTGGSQASGSPGDSGQGAGQTQGQDSQGQNGPQDNQQGPEGQFQQMYQKFAGFAEGKLDQEQLMNQELSKLQQQRQLTNEFKYSLKEMHDEFKNMGEEQRLQNSEDFEALMNQIKEAQRYMLQINLATQEQARLLLGDCIPDGVPDEGEIEETSEILGEL